MELSLFNNSDTISKQEQDFIILIKSVIDAFAPQAEQNGIDLTFSVKEEEIPYFTKYPFDKIKFKQVLTNLIRNAFEATKSGDYINIECALSLPTYLTIAVHNNGEMIPAEEISTIFQPFVTYKSGGSGLGLAISSNIINAHSGTIQVTSSEEKTSFTIQLPVI
jgi:signal transduction histidine kinase